MKRKLLLAILALPVVLGAFAIKDRVTFDKAAWLQDYDSLKSGLEQSYANLQWSRSAKSVDLVALNKKTLAALEAAHNTAQARRVIVEFLQGFNDGHLHIESGPPKPVVAIMNLWPKKRQPEITFAMSGGEACSAMGYNGKSKLDGEVIKSGNASYVYIRIPIFHETDYAWNCEGAWQRFRSATSRTCDDDCQYRFAIIAMTEISQDLANTATRLSNGRSPVVIDLTGNGGGSEWSQYVAAALTKKALTPARVLGIRTEHWKEELGDSASVRCDMAGIWKDPAFQPSCWNVAMLPPDSSSIHHIAQPYDGPLYALVDGRTASASEEFVALLKDAGAITVVGEKTLGAGCGYTNGGVTITLPHSGLVVDTPDCVRLRVDGSNEYAGITPDYVVKLGSSAAEKISALHSARLSR